MTFSPRRKASNFLVTDDRVMTDRSSTITNILNLPNAFSPPRDPTEKNASKFRLRIILIVSYHRSPDTEIDSIESTNIRPRLRNAMANYPLRSDQFNSLTVVSFESENPSTSKCIKKARKKKSFSSRHAIDRRISVAQNRVSRLHPDIFISK